MNSPAVIQRDALKIGFISTRFGGTDGVSLEARKWVHVLKRHGHTCFFMAGSCDWPADCSYMVAEAFFKHPDILEINQQCFGSHTRDQDLTLKIHQLKEKLKTELYRFVNKFDLDLLLVENALSIPMNLPLGLALTEFIAQTGYPTIAHHHDMFWERKRFLVNCVWDYLNMAFPPHLPSIHHVVINSSAANQLSLRTGISSAIIPNVMNFSHPPQPPDDYTKGIRRDLGIHADEALFLQPTRVVPRKGIEHAIELIRRLDQKARLVISQASGDEGDAYEQRVRTYAQLMDVQVNFVADQIGEQRGKLPDGRKIYSLWDVYPFADLVTYPSTIEGFGNAFLEAVYFRRPIMVNNYSIFSYDIKPKGFQVIEFDGYIDQHTLENVTSVLRDQDRAEKMTEHNYQLGRKYYSFEVLDRQLEAILSQAFGEAPDQFWETNLHRLR